MIYIGGDSQYKSLYLNSNNIEVDEEPVSQLKKIPHCAVKYEAGEENRIVYESLYWMTCKLSLLAIIAKCGFQISKLALLYQALLRCL